MNFEICAHDFRIHVMQYDQFSGGTTPLTEPTSAIVVCRKCGATRRTVVEFS